MPVKADLLFQDSVTGSTEVELRLAGLARANSWVAVQAEAARSGQVGRKAFGFALQPVTERERGLYDRFRYLFSSAPIAFDGSQVLRAFQAQTEARLAVSAIALKRLRLANGNFPNALSELAPQFLATVPIDPMDGLILKYRQQSTNGFLLYSSGVNGTDDDGDPSWSNDEERFRSIWSGTDAIWPTASAPK